MTIILWILAIIGAVHIGIYCAQGVIIGIEYTKDQWGERKFNKIFGRSLRESEAAKAIVDNVKKDYASLYSRFGQSMICPKCQMPYIKSSVVHICPDFDKDRKYAKVLELMTNYLVDSCPLITKVEQGEPIMSGMNPLLSGEYKKWGGPEYWPTHEHFRFIPAYGDILTCKFCGDFYNTNFFHLCKAKYDDSEAKAWESIGKTRLKQQGDSMTDREFKVTQSAIDNLANKITNSKTETEAYNALKEAIPEAFSKNVDVMELSNESLNIRVISNVKKLTDYMCIALESAPAELKGQCFLLQSDFNWELRHIGYNKFLIPTKK